jgi:hypothetical protein
MKRLLLGAVLLLVFAAPAQAADIERIAQRGTVRPTVPALVQKALGYLPADGYVLHYRRASARVVHIEMAELASPKNDWFGLPPEFWEGVPHDAEWITVYTVRFRRDDVAVCVGGLGVIRRFPR